MGVNTVTAAQVRRWWTRWIMEGFDNTVNTLNNCYECNNQGHVRRDCPSKGQPRLMYSNEEFDSILIPLGNYWEFNKPGHVRRNCPDLGKIQDELQWRTREGHQLLQL